jgi:hypothetical protein
MQQQLFELHLNLLNYALKRGYLYRRWQTIANAILFKDADNVRIHRTRVIHIYEADFNLALGLKWRAAIHQAEDNQQLNDGQYGSRPRRNAIDPVLIEEAQFEISRASRKMFVQTNFDASSCYDRIIPNLAMVASRKYGVTEESTVLNATTLEKAEYRIRTELGLAPNGYSHSEVHPIYGTGQGSANSPAIWCFVSSTLFDCYKEVSHAADYCSPTLNQNMQLNMIAYVDDSNGQTNSFLYNDQSKIVNRTLTKVRHNAQAWTNLVLGVSGGAVELSKCSCHIMEWIFSRQGAPVLSPRHRKDIQIQVSDPTTKRSSTLNILSPYQAHKTLGHFKEPAGVQKEQYSRLLQKSNECVAFLWKCPLSQKEAWTFYFACYLPSGYPLPASSLTLFQLEKVQRKAMSIIVPRCGYNRNTKKKILFGPLSLGGANFRHLYIEQGIGQVTTFLKHVRSQSTTGKQFQIALSWFQLAVGVSFPILENTRPALPHLESRWLASLRIFLASQNAAIHLQVPYIPPYNGYTTPTSWMPSYNRINSHPHRFGI